MTLLLEYDGAATTSNIVFSDGCYGRAIELTVEAAVTEIQVKLAYSTDLGDEACAKLKLEMRETPTADSELPELVASSQIDNPGLSLHPTYSWVVFPFSSCRLQPGHTYLLLAVGCEARYGDKRFRLQSQGDPGIPANQRAWRWLGWTDPTELEETADHTTSIRVYGEAPSPPESGGLCLVKVEAENSTGCEIYMDDIVLVENVP